MATPPPHPQGYHTQLASLQRQRRELRESLQGQSPEMSLYQEQRQVLKDKIIGLAASLAGLRSNISYNTKSIQELTETFKTNSQLLTVSAVGVADEWVWFHG